MPYYGSMLNGATMQTQVNSPKSGADRFTAIVARVFDEIEARGISLEDLGGQSVDEIAAEIAREFSSDTNTLEK